MDMQGELNRAVRRKRNAWWLYVDGRPVDPLATVPAATTPHDMVRGDLVALSAPLNFNELRSHGQLCAPTGPTHTGIQSLPVTDAGVTAAVAVDQAAQPVAVRRMVAMDYDTDSGSIPSRSSPSAPVTSGSGTSREDVGESDCDHTPDCSTDSSSDTITIRQGAGRGHRLDHVSVSDAALIGDLGKTPHGLLIEHQCARRILDTDSKATRAIFQANGPSQRASAFAAALSRAGLNTMAEGMKKAEVFFQTQENSATLDSGAAADELTSSASGSVSTDPYSVPPVVRKRGRPPASQLPMKRESGEQPSQPNASARDDNTDQLTALVERLHQLEQWAHGVDATLRTWRPAAPGIAQDDAACRSTAPSPLQNSDCTSVNDSTLPEESDVCRVTQRVADIEKVLVEGDLSSTPRSTLSTRVTSLETQMDEQIGSLNLLRLRPVREALGSDVTSHDLELDLNWRLGMLEMTVAAQASDMLSLKDEVRAASQRSAAATPPPPPATPPAGTPNSLASSSSSTCVHVKAEITKLHQGLTQLATLMLQMRQRCDQAAAAWAGTLGVPRS
eukprot:683694-Amphidinium_carterae.1